MHQNTPRFSFGLLALVFAGACSNDGGLKVYSQPPSVTITEPSVDSTFFEGQVISFAALVQPGNESDDPTSITHRWVSGNETMCESDAVGADGYGYCSFGFSGTGEKTVEVTVTDQRGDRARASTRVIIEENTAPTIEIINPLDGDSFLADEPVRFDVVVTDVEEDASDLTVSMLTTIDGDVALDGVPASSGDYATSVLLSEGLHLVTMTVEDSYGRTDQDSVEIEVFGSEPPSLDTVSILPTPAYTTDTLTADPQGWEDRMGGAEEYLYEWTVNGSVDLGEGTATYPSGKTSKGDLVQVVLTPINDYGEGDAVASPTIEIANTPPETPTIRIVPTSPEPSDSLQCSVILQPSDADGDRISHVYEWYRDGSITTETTNVVSSTALAHGETWECVARAFDGEDYSAEARESAIIVDATAPDAPLLDTPDPYRNEDSIDITGDCEPGCTVVVYCADSSTSWTDTETCDSAGTFEYSTALTRGDVSSCYADCTDSAGNTSGVSNTVTTEVCDPYDTYEDSTGYGDAGTDPVDEWSSLADAGTTTISIEGNVLGSDSEDWYVISTSDDLASDLTAGIDYYNFDVQLVAGSSDYAFLVYRGSPDPSDLECSATYGTSGYTEYSDFVQDSGDGSHSVPSDTRLCGSGSSSYNDCEDMSNDYYIQVFRRASSTPSCQQYELEITNGVW